MDEYIVVMKVKVNPEVRDIGQSPWKEFKGVIEAAMEACGGPGIKTTVTEVREL